MKPTTRLVLGILVLAGAALSAADPIRIRAEFTPGLDLHYQWHLEATNTWTPPVPGTEWSVWTRPPLARPSPDRPRRGT